MPPLPFLENQPELDEHLGFVWRAFSALSSDRQLGMSMGPIPWAAIDRYARRFGIAGLDEFEIFAALICAMDAAYLDHAAEKADKGGKT